MPNRPPGPTPQQVRAAREAAGQTQTEAAAVVHATLNGWQKWEQGERGMSAALFDLYLLRTGQHPDHVLLPREHVDWLFSEPEWNALRDMLNGTIIEPLAIAAPALAGEWRDAMRDGLAEKWGVDGVALLTRLEALSQPEAAAVVQSACGWWKSLPQPS